MATAQVMANVPVKDELVPELQAWHQAKVRADRHNRNLLQYGATIMALLGITAGSAGLIAVADSLQEGSGLQWALFVLAVVPLVAAVVAIGTTLWLYRAYKDRQAAESDAEVHFARLIALDPDRFLPKAE